MGNIKITLQGGLHADYGIFNLDANMLRYIKVDVITSGDQYVESQEAGYQHGSTSGLRDHEGIKPIDSNIPVWDNYGPTLATKLTNYYKDKIQSMSSDEIWDNYSIYGNQFSLEFDKEEGEQDVAYDGSELSYVSYLNEEVPFDTRVYKTYDLETLYNSGIEMKAYIIHFSKYYYVYNTVSGSQQTLRPLLYYASDLDLYNMGIYEMQESGEEDVTGIPYVRNLIGLEWYRHKSGWHRCEEIYHTVRSFDTTARFNSNVVGAYGDPTNFCEDEESSGNGHDWSQFATNPKDRPTFENYSTKEWGSIPEGFSLWGLGGDHGYYICSNNTPYSDDTTKLPNTYTSVFNPSSKLRWRNSESGGHVHSSEGGNDSLLGVMFRFDKNNNHHLFNTYFPVEGNAHVNSGTADTGKISQIIKYTGSKRPYPKYVGTVLASILANIYIYGDEPSGVIKYVQDIVFLEEHSTIYTKDLVYRAYVSFGNPTNDSEQNQENQENQESTVYTNNDLLLIRGSYYNTYLQSLKNFISDSDDPDKVFNDTNVTLELKECIKNVPIQFKMDYIQPDLNVIGAKSSVRVQNIDGTSFDVVSDGIKPNELYFIDSNDQIQFFRNTKAFRIKWLKSLKIQDDKLIGVYDETLEPTNNPYLGESINYEEGKLGFKVSKLSSYTNGQCYCIYSQNGSFGNILSDLLINDILVPAARIS